MVRDDAVLSKAGQLASIYTGTFWPVLSPRFWCHPSSRLSVNAIGSSYSSALPAAFPCKLSFPMCKLPSPATASPPDSAPHAGGPRRGVPGVPGAGSGTYSRGLGKPRQGSPPAHVHLRFSAVPVVVSPPSLACNTPAGRNSPKTRAAFREAMPGAEQPLCPGHSLPSGAPAGTANTRGSSPAQCRGTVR